MKVFLVDKFKVNIYTLPEKIEDAFPINYVSYNGVEELITITAENNNWYISSGYDVNIYKDTLLIEKEQLTNDCAFTIKFSDLNDTIKLYCFEKNVKYLNYAIGNKSEITLGNQGSFDITYNNPYISSPHFKIYRYNNAWILEDNGYEENLVFVNNYRVRKTVLKFGDVIFTNGLKIIWADLFFRITNPNSAVTVNLEQYQEYAQDAENTYTPVLETEKGIVLYNDNQVFFHTPRIRTVIKEKTITIEKPPEKIEEDKTPAILTLGATVMMGMSSSITGIIAVFSVATGKATLISSITEITLCITMMAGCVLFPILQDKFQKKLLKKKEQKRQKKYTEYIESKKTEIQQELQKEKEILFFNYLSAEECKQAIINKTDKLWGIEIADQDFLTLRLGLGNKKADIKIDAYLEDFSLEDDNLKDMVKEIKNTPLNIENAPVTISLIENNILPLVINYDYPYRQQYINNILLQIITHFSGMDLKIVILTSKDNEKNWEYFKYMSHCYSADRKIRLFASSDDEIKQVSAYLENEYQARYNVLNNNNSEEQENSNNNLADNFAENEKYKVFDDYYLVITDNYVNAKRYGFLDKIMSTNKNLGFSLLTIDYTMNNIPSKCNKFIQINNAGGTIFNKEVSEEGNTSFAPEFFNENISDYARVISNIPVAGVNAAGALPPSLSFLEMYKVGKIDQLNIMNRWTKNDPTISLHTPLGVRSDGKLFEIDLHEKFHGPHGLIAGATGSGKSEFIITFILSMAVNYHPYEVQFVLIDYKGGGLAGAFENRETGIKIPHLAGTITNLDTSEMNRTLVSINSELKRRQRMFNEARDALGESTVDIYKYQKFYREGKVKEPISHLFIISDEFAELKAQQPDFMDELVSTARIGRSLGVHLILATQKPAGVVDDQIWSNSRFKICLKVQTAEDSMELLKRPEAATIKETGRFYLQVGFNELFDLGQSGWAGAKYLPTDQIVKTIDDSIDIIDNTGNTIIKLKDEVKKENQVDYGDQLTNIVKTLYNIAKRENLDFKQLWLPSIPKEIFLSNVIKKYDYKPVPYEINPVIGEYDNPAAQLQNVLTMDLTNNGNLIIFGNAGTGKENLLTTLIYSICIHHSPDEVNFYILDYGAEVLKIFNKMPHVGDIGLVDDKEKLHSCLLMLDRELSKRKEIFSEYGGNYTSYLKNSGKKLPLIITVINGYESFMENFGDYDEFLTHLLRDSAKYGIIFITTAVAVNSVRSSAVQLYNNKIATQLADAFDYKFTINAPDGLTPGKNFGRGVATVGETAYEFQTANVYVREKINDIIKDTSEKMCQVYKKVHKIPVIPSKVNSDTLTPYVDNLSNVPIGINVATAEVVKYNFELNRINQIVGSYAVTEPSFINELVKVLSSAANTKVKVIDFMDCIYDTSSIDYHNGEFTDTINSIIEDDKNSKFKIVNVIIGIGLINDRVLDEGIEKLYKIFSNLEQFKNSYFVLIDNFSTYKRIANEEWYSKSVKKNNGIWLGKDADIQNSIVFNNLTKSDANEDFKCLAYSVVNGEYEVFKCIGNEESDD